MGCDGPIFFSVFFRNREDSRYFKPELQAISKWQVDNVLFFNKIRKANSLIHS